MDALVLGSPRDMRNSHLHHPKAMTDRSETHPLTNLERHGQRGYRVTRNTEGEVRNMPVRDEGKWGGEGGMTRGQLAFGQLRRKTLKKPQTPAANRAFLRAKAPLAEGGVLGERSCFWPEAPGNAGPGPGGPASRFRVRTAATRVAAEGPGGLERDLAGTRDRWEGGGCRQRLTVMRAPKQKRCLAAIREGALVLSGSSNAKTREEEEPGWNRRGARTHEGS